MNRRYLFAGLGCLGVSAACRLLYLRNGAYVDADGVLHESFGFIPLGFLFAFAGAALLFLSLVRRK